MAIYKKVKDGKTLGFYYSVYYKDVYGNRKRKCSKTFKTKKECEVEEAKFKGTLINQDTMKNITFGNFAENYYLVEKQKSWKVRSFIKNSRSIYTYAKPIWNIQLDSINSLMIADLYNKLFPSHSISGANQILCRISCVFNFAVKHDFIKNNPCQLIETKKSSKVKIDNQGNVIDLRNNIWNESDFETFIKYFDGTARHQIKLKALFSTLFYTGMRVGEVSCLKVNDVDLENNCIRVNKSYDSLTQTITTPKTTSSYRTIYFGKKLHNILESYMEHIKNINIIVILAFCLVFVLLCTTMESENNFKWLWKQQMLRKLEFTI